MRDLWAKLFVAQVALAIGALDLHYRVHAPTHLTFFWASFFSAADLVVVSALFCFRGTAMYAVIVKGFVAFIGIIMMADFSIHKAITSHVSFLVDPLAWFRLSLFPDIAILVGGFIVGLALYEATMSK
jgi:hypothetical protein